MKTISLTDVTIRESAKSRDTNLSFKEKIEMAKIMDKLHYSYIELPEISDAKTDTLLIKTIATSLKHSSIVCPVGLDPENVERVWNCISNAEKPVLKVAVPVSTVQIEYVCGKKPEAVLERITELISECKKYTSEIEFAAEDATRAEGDYLISAIDAAIKAGASKITVCDTAGVKMPYEFDEFISDIMKSVPGIEKIPLAVEIANELDMSTACAFSGIMAGASEIKTTIKGFNYPEIESVVNVISKKGRDLGFDSNMKQTELNRSVNQMVWLTEPKKAGSIEISGIPSDLPSLTLNINDDLATVSQAASAIGYDLSEEDKVNVYEAFKRVARRKEFVGTKELDAIIASTALAVPATYTIENYVINSGNLITATANIKLMKNGEALCGISVGDGPIDASFLAIEQILGHHYELDDFQIQAVTEGREAMGSALVKLRSNGKLYSGNGISTDIIGASIRAYVSAINKIAYEEE